MTRASRKSGSRASAGKEEKSPGTGPVEVGVHSLSVGLIHSTNMSLEILHFPREWNFFPRCDQQVYEVKKCAASGGKCVNFSDSDGVVLCSCHHFCQLHCRKGLEDGNSYEVTVTWRQLLRPYISIVPSSLWNAHVLNDLVHKINGIDFDGLNCLLGCLLHSADDDVLCRLLLELGVDKEVRYLQGPGSVPSVFMKEPVNVNVVSGTAVHFAAVYLRPKCLKALIDAGCDTNVLNAAGKSALDLAEDQNVKKLLTEAATNGRKSLAQQAKEGLFFAIRNSVRTGKIERKELVTNFFEGKSVIDWLNAITTKNHVIPNDLDASILAQQVLAELQFRYDYRNMSRVEVLSQALFSAAGAKSELMSTCEEDPSKILHLMLEGISNLLGAKEKNMIAAVEASKKDEADGAGDGK